MECEWCDREGEHTHYQIKLTKNGKVVGKLASNGRPVKYRRHAVVLTDRSKALKVVAQVNQGGNYTAETITF